jgi:hypothetical protein
MTNTYTGRCELNGIHVMLCLLKYVWYGVWACLVKFVYVFLCAVPGSGPFCFTKGTRGRQRRGEVVSSILLDYIPVP